MANEIEIGITTIENLIEITSQSTDQVVDIGVTDNRDDVTINVTPTVIEININKNIPAENNLVTSVNTRIGDVVIDANDVGLGNVDNTGDFEKPISTDVQAALNSKADLIDGLVPEIQLPVTALSIMSGLSQGGVMSINTDTAKFDVTAGFGYIVNGHTNPNIPIKTKVSFTASTANVVPNLATQQQTFVSIDINGALNFTPNPLTPTERRNFIRLGVLVHLDNANIIFIDNQPTVNIEVGGQVQDILEAFGFRSLSGNRIFPVAANLKIKKELGKLFKAGANFKNLNTQPHTFTLQAQDPITFKYRTQTGAEGSAITDINPAIYDVNGTITAIPATATLASVQRIYIFQDGTIRIQPGQKFFNNLNEAVTAINSDVFINDVDISENALYLGAIVMIRGTTALNNLAQAIFVPSSGVGINGSTSAAPLGYTAEDAANKQNSLAVDGTAAKYPTVDAVNIALTTKADLVGGLVPVNQLPSYVDDVLEFANLAAFPATGETGKIYIALDSNKQYRWTGSAYLQITNGLIASTNDVPEGSNNLYFTAARVLANVLTGLSTASSAVISATDTILSAFGKLQSQVSINNGKISFDNTSSTRLANTSGTNTGDQNLQSVVTKGGTASVDGNKSSVVLLGGTANARFTESYVDNGLALNSGKKGTFLLQDNDNLEVQSYTDTSLGDMSVYQGQLSFLQKSRVINAETQVNFTAPTAVTTLKFPAKSSGTYTLATTADITGTNSGTNTGDQTLTSLGAAPSSGSANYIQNVTVQQTANLNISGSGVFGSSVTAKQLLISNPFGSSLDAAFISQGEFNKIGLRIKNTNAAANTNIFQVENSSSTLFGVLPTGAATFASSVTATSHVTTGGSATQLVKGDGGLTVGYKVYTALLSQSGTAAPVATVLENTLGGTVVWGRTNAGFYTGTLSNSFISGKTFYPPSSSTGANENIRIYNYISNTSQIRLDTYFLSSNSDGILNNTTVEIRVYN
jgi:hypothetical protein